MIDTFDLCWFLIVLAFFVTISFRGERRGGPERGPRSGTRRTRKKAGAGAELKPPKKEGGAYTGPGMYRVILYEGHMGKFIYVKANSAGRLIAGEAGPRGENFKSLGYSLEPEQVIQSVENFTNTKTERGCF